MRAAIVREAESWLGTPFHRDAMLKGVGVDCGRMLIAVYGEFGFQIPAESEIPRLTHDWHFHERRELLRDFVSTFMRPVADPLPGDAAMFRYGRVYAHLAIVSEWPKVISATQKGGVIWDDASQPPLSRAKSDVLFFSLF